MNNKANPPCTVESDYRRGIVRDCACAKCRAADAAMAALVRPLFAKVSP